MYENREKGHEFYFHRDIVLDRRGKQKYKKHYHDLFEIYFIDSGSCCYFIDNKTYQLQAGDVIMVPAGIVHNTEYKNTGHSRRLINCADWFIPPAVRPLFCTAPCHFRNPDTVKEIKEILQKIESEYENPDAFSEESFRSYIYRFFILIARNLPLNTARQNEKHYIEDAIAYLQANFAANITLADMAKLYFVSPEHFSRVFKKETGFNFSEYLVLLRLKKAESLLRQLNASTVTEIAQSCGFNDSNYFSVRFKKLYGMSPKKYQSINRRDAGSWTMEDPTN